MRLHRLHALAAAALMTFAVSAESFGSCTVSELIDSIIAQNDALKAQRLTIDAQRLDDADANALADPEVALSRVWGRHAIGNKLQLDVSQEIDWPALYAQRSRAADMAQSTALLEYGAAELELRGELTSLLYELVYVRRQITEQDGLLRSFVHLAEYIRQNGAGSDLTKIDLMKLDYENHRMQTDLNALYTLEGQIKSALQSYTSTPLDLQGITEYPLQQMLTLEEYEQLASASPAFGALRAAADQEQQNARVASLSRFPSLTVGYQHQAEMGDRFNGFTVGVNVPIFQGRRAKKAALERKAAAELSLQNLADKTRAEISSVYAEAQSYKQQMEAFRKVFVGTEFLDLVTEAYKGGEMSMLEYLAEAQYFSEAMLGYMELEYNYQTALASLNRYVK